MKKLQLIKSAKKIVIKIGSSLLIDNGKFNHKWLRSFVEDLDSFLNKNQIIIVASGAVSLGKSYLKFNNNDVNLNIKQAFAACGQIFLMNNFIKVFEEKKKKVAQILLTFSDTEDRRRSLNSRETIKSLILSDVIPIINENDTVATDELKFGDNDRLAARVAQIVEADLLLLLTDVKGLYNQNPKHYDNAKLLETVKKIDSQIYKMASSQTNSYGSGGMFTKIQAAEIAGSYGCNTLIFQGNIDNPFKNLKKNDVGSLFISSEKKKKGVKNWLAGSINISGTLEIDNGAINALNKGASLLPIGIQRVLGKFSKGDIIEIIDYNGKKLGKGISYYDANEVEMIKGKKSTLIKKILGYEGREEIIHRDYLYLSKR
tara:strand:- start:1668 stop:2786 length:1119 start_codon:yes stop_codon:yes gene_type:complete